ncbi:MAG TPA: hypothetical protein VFA70_13560, partial [Dehalococcoidia bacterium]|nr:hypothetical protein [Dehalococcoidia bacterium]
MEAPNDRGRFRALRAGVAALVALLALLGLVSAYAGFDVLGAVGEVQAAQADLGGALHGGALLNLTRDQVRADGRRLADASSRLQRDRVLLRPSVLLLRGAGWIPGIGTPLAESGRLLDLAADVAAGGAALTQGVDPLLAEIDAPPATAGAPSAPPAQRLLQALDGGAAWLAAGDADLNAAARLRRGLHPDQYRGPFRPLQCRV